tara:strand:+ start:342 stop:497 length:156 start_codon:yes stop_codon:yes gene_type:complete
VTPLSCTDDGEYLWRCGGLYVWKSVALQVSGLRLQEIVIEATDLLPRVNYQ